MNRRAVAIGALAVVAATAACNEKHATLTDPVGASAYGYQLASLATNLPRGSVRYKFHATPAAVTPDSLVVTLQGIDTLNTGFYTAWVGDSLGTTFKRIAGTLSYQRTDTALDALGNILSQPQPAVTVGTVSSLQNGNPRTTYTWRFERINAGLATTDSMVTFLITIESSASATTPNATRRPIFARRSEGAPAAGAATSPIRFGNYSGDPTYQFVYSATPARGRGVTWGKILEATDSTIQRPPLGYYYAMWLIRFVPAGATNGDTLFLGDITSPPPRRNISMHDVDSLITDPLVVLPPFPSAVVGGGQIIAAGVRINSDTIAKLPKGVACTGYPAGQNWTCPFKSYSEVRLTLEAKDGFRGHMSGARVLGAVLPFVVTAGQR